MRVGYILIAAIGVLVLITFPTTPQGVDYWPCDETPGLPDEVEFLTSLGVAMLGDQVPIAIFEDRYWRSPQTIACWFDGTDWHPIDLPLLRECCDIAEGPDGKLWLKFFEYSDTVGYMDAFGYHEPRWARTSGMAYGYSIDIMPWRNEYFILVGQDVLDRTDAAFGFYCKPSCDEIDFVGRVDNGAGPVRRCAISGDYLAILSSRCRIIDLASAGFWDLPGNGLRVSIAEGTNSYFWGGSPSGSGLLQIDAATRSYHALDWAEGLALGAIAVNWQGVCMVARPTRETPPEPLVLVYWSLQQDDLIRIEEVPLSMGAELVSGSALGAYKLIKLTTSGDLWFTTEKAVGRWRLEDAPVPFEARIEALRKEEGGVGVSIEFDNLRIIRNDATLRLDIEYFADGQQEPLPGTLTFDVYYEFQPQEAFCYSFEYVPVMPPSADRIRYSVYTAYIDVNAPPTDEEIITSNVATAEVRLD